MERRSGGQGPRAKEAGAGPSDPRFYEALGRAIKVHRARQDLDRKELAERAGVSYPYLAEIENGKKRASSRALVSIAEALGLLPHELLETAEDVRSTLEPHRDEAGRAGNPMPEESHLALPVSPGFRERGGVADRPNEEEAAREGQHGFWFGRVTSAEEPRPEASVFAMAAGPPPGRTRSSDLVSELLSLAAGLPHEDLERLVDLARRLRG